MKALLAFLCSATWLGAQGFSLTGNAFAHLTVRPPNIWIDVMQFTNPSPPVATADATLTTNYVDFSGHGLTFFDRSTDTDSGNTNFYYYTRLGGVFSGNEGVTGGMNIPVNGPTNAQLHVANYVNRITFALRLNYRADSVGGAQFQTGRAGPPGTQNYAAMIMDTGLFNWDFGCCGGAQRIVKALPPGATNGWFNYFFTHNGTNSSIWVDGTNYASGLVATTITNNAANPGNYTSPPTGRFGIMSGNHATNYYVKRFLVWDYELPQADIEHWNRYMTYLP